VILPAELLPFVADICMAATPKMPMEKIASPINTSIIVNP
jgi:hypothetical protein